MYSEFKKNNLNVKAIDLEALDNFALDPIISNNQWLKIKNINQVKKVNLNFKFNTLAREEYDYFPFNVVFCFSDRRVEIFEVDGIKDEYEINFQNIEIENNSIDIYIYGESYAINKNNIKDERDILGFLTDIKCSKPTKLNQSSAINYKQPKPKYFLGPLNQENVSDRPIFLLGAYRSGTSISTWAVGSHPNLLPIDETGWLHHFIYGNQAAFKNAQLGPESVINTLNLKENDFLRYFGKAMLRYQHAVYSNGIELINQRRLSGLEKKYHPLFIRKRTPLSPVKRLIGGAPENSTLCHLLSEVFQGAKFIYIIRHPVDVIKSMVNFGKGYSIEDATKMWCRNNYFLYDFYKKNPDKCFFVDYSKLIKDPDFYLASIFEFLDEPNFINASEVFTQTINSSHVSKDFALPDFKDRDVLESIYQDIQQGVAFEKINWIHSPGNIDEFHYHIADRFLNLIRK